MQLMSASTRRIPMTLVALGVGLLVTSGCQSGGSRDGNASLASAVRDPILQDLPRPQGFRLDEQRSMARASGQFRIARCEYRGSSSSISTKRFYEQYMPSARFKLTEWGLEDGVYNMRFESENESCNIRIRDAGGGTTIVVIELGPRPRGAIGRPDPTPPPPGRGV